MTNGTVEVEGATQYGFPDVYFKDYDLILPAMLHLISYLLFILTVYLIVHGAVRKRKTGNASPFPPILTVNSMLLLTAGLVAIFVSLSDACTSYALYMQPGEARSSLLVLSLGHSLRFGAVVIAMASAGFVGAQVLALGKSKSLSENPISSFSVRQSESMCDPFAGALLRSLSIPQSLLFRNS